MERGKETCRALKDLRQRIADANGIAYTPTECHHKGDCAGTCPACEAELQYIEQQLSLRRMLGKAVVVAGLGLAVAAPAQAQEACDTVATQQTCKNEIFGEVPGFRPPCFPGGDARLMKYITEHIDYSRLPKEAHIEGKPRVIVQFCVMKDGSVDSVKVARSLGPQFDAEAVRVVKSLPKFTPGMEHGELADIGYTLPVNFNLEKLSSNQMPLSDIPIVGVVDMPNDTTGVYNAKVEHPSFPGGDAALVEFLSNNIKYPENAAKKKIEGKVVVSFLVKGDDTVADPVILRSVDPELDAEALRVVSIMPRWTPFLWEGKVVSEAFTFTLPVIFKIPDEKKK